MADKTAIPWTNATWNVATGCTKISPGCKHCYMYRQYPRLKEMGQQSYQKSPFEITLVHDQLTKPLRWKRPRLIFPCSMSDLFHEDIPDHFLVQVYAIMALTPQHRYQVLTKRPENVPGLPARHPDHELVRAPGSTFVSSPTGRNPGWLWGEVIKGEADAIRRLNPKLKLPEYDGTWPLKNLWLGVSVESQEYTYRLDTLAQLPAVVHWCSYEPALEALNLRPWLKCETCLGGGRVVGDSDIDYPVTDQCSACQGKGKLLDWVVAGGESGGPEDRMLVEREKLRNLPTHWMPKVEAIRWMLDMRNQCVATDTAFFFKQWGGPKPTSGGADLGGREWLEFPEPIAA